LEWLLHFIRQTVGGRKEGKPMKGGWKEDAELDLRNMGVENGE
jgi:hypothetical protein